MYRRQASSAHLDLSKSESLLAAKDVVGFLHDVITTNNCDAHKTTDQDSFMPTHKTNFAVFCRCFIIIISVKTTLALHFQAPPFTQRTPNSFNTPFEASAVALSTPSSIFPSTRFLPNLRTTGTSIFTMANPNDDCTGFEPVKTEEQKQIIADMLSSVLPNMNTQEGSPPNTFTESELQELQAALPNMNIRPRGIKTEELEEKKPPSKIMDICAAWEAPEPTPIVSTAGPQEAPSLDWHGAPSFTNPAVQLPRSFRQKVRAGLFTGPTNAQCPGYLQCNLVVLEKDYAFDFLLFCQRNPKSCPLIEVCDVGSSTPFGIAPDADLRTDCPK
jgi:hypothetical protein